MEIKYRKQQQLFLIFGAPGTGKSTLAALMSARLNGAIVVNTDLIKEWLQMSYANSIFNLNSHDAWKLVGEKNDQNIIEGFEKYADAFLDSIQALLIHLFKKFRIVILEGVHFTKNGLSILGQNFWDTLPIFIPVHKTQYRYFAQLKTTVRISERNPWLESFDVIEVLDRYFHSFSLEIENLFITSPEHNSFQILDTALNHFISHINVFR